MKILLIGDIPNWAIGHLGKAIIKHNDGRHTFKELFVHPKEVGFHIETVLQTLKEFQPDLIHYNYWNTARQLLEMVPELREYKSVLSHHNEKDLLSADWKELGITAHVVETNLSKKVLEDDGYKPYLVRLAIDVNSFIYRPKYESHQPFVIGYAGRVVPWKNLHAIAEVAKELGCIVRVMGKLTDKPSYYNSIDQSVLDLTYVECSDENRLAFYNSLDCFVCFSSDGRETGPLPVMEAMASGVPVITTPCGQIRDLGESGKNCLVVDFDNKIQLKEAIKQLRDDKDLCQTIREGGWSMVKNMDERVFAWDYSRIYYLTKYNKPLVTAIIPYTSERKELVKKIGEALRAQTYGAMEIIAFEDKADGYNLAEVRNKAAIEAQGEYLLFCDSRLLPEPNAVDEFMKVAIFSDPKQKTWLFGEKGGNKSTFVENFSFIKRSDFIAGGMCNERITKYGGMSQELRERFGRQGFKFGYVPDAKATQMIKAHFGTTRRQDIVDSKVLLHKLNLT